MTYEDFTTYTEVDPNSHIGLVGTNHVDFQAWMNEDAYLYKDKGVDHFGTSWEHKIDVKYVSQLTSHAAALWMLSNDIDDLKALNLASKPAILVYAWWTGSISVMAIQEYYQGVAYGSSQFTMTAGTMYYLTLNRNGTAFTCKIYSDSARTNLLATLSLTLHGGQPSHRYVWVADEYNNGQARWGDFDIENLDLQEGGAILKEVADSLSLSDSLLCNKTFAVTDSVGLADAPLKHWTPQISDSIALSDAVLRNKTFQILDSLGLSDTILRGKQFSVSDFISLCELITVITEIIKQVTDSLSLSDGVGLNKALLVADQIRLTDNVYVNKILIISDSMALAEVVEKSVQGVVKTRIFLIIGDLAIQLTGD